MLSILGMSQLPLLKERSWVFTAGAIGSFPVAPPYFDHSVTTGADYFWEYHVVPIVTSGWMLGLSYAGNLDLEKGFGFYEWGLKWQIPSTGLRYDGWSGGGSSGVIYHGKGTRSWTDYKLSLGGKISHQVSFGKKNREVINGIGLCLELTLFQSEHFVFSGEQSQSGGTVPLETDTRTFRWIGSGLGIPDLKMYYEFGYVLRSASGAWIPGFRTSFLNFSKFIPQPFPPHEGLRRREEYYKELMVVLTWIPRAKD